MTGIQLSGLASGMDTDAIISQLMSIESQPRTRVARQQVAIQAPYRRIIPQSTAR